MYGNEMDVHFTHSLESLNYLWYIFVSQLLFPFVTVVDWKKENVAYVETEDGL